MGKTVCLFRAIKPEWLDRAAELAVQGCPEAEAKAAMDEYLSFEIGSVINRRKTRQLLMNTWARPAETSETVRSKAIEAFKSGGSDRIPLHWALFVLAHPLFADAACLIGKIAAAQDTFTSSWLKAKLCEARGERSAIIRSATGILETMRRFGCVRQEKKGVYRAVRRAADDRQAVDVLLLGLLALGRQAYYEISELPRHPLFFPFEFSVSRERLHHSSDFTLENFGGKTVLVK